MCCWCEWHPGFVQNRIIECVCVCVVRACVLVQMASQILSVKSDKLILRVDVYFGMNGILDSFSA